MNPGTRVQFPVRPNLSWMAQRKSAGPITRRSYDRNILQLFIQIICYLIWINIFINDLKPPYNSIDKSCKGVFCVRENHCSFSSTEGSFALNPKAAIRSIRAINRSTSLGAAGFKKSQPAAPKRLWYVIGAGDSKSGLSSAALLSPSPPPT